MTTTHHQPFRCVLQDQRPFATIIGTPKMPTKRQQSVGEAGPASKRGKHAYSHPGEASSDGLSFDSSSPHETCDQDKQITGTGRVDMQGHPPSIRIIQPINEAEEPLWREPAIDLTGDSPSSKSAATSRAPTPVEAYDACFGMVGHCLLGLSSHAVGLTFLSFV